MRARRIPTFPTFPLTLSRRRSRRRGQSGQVAPIVGLFAILLLAAAALATDLSVTTNLKRSLQNQTDAAALAGAQQLPASPQPADQQNATATALSLLHNTYPWPTSGQTWSGPNWSSNLASLGCGGGACSVTICAGIDPAGVPCTATVTPTGVLPFTLTVNTPPKSAATGVLTDSSDNYDHYAEVVMQQEEGTFFAGVLGVSTSVDGAHSVAYHFAPNQAFPFALYSRTFVQTGNDGEVISGNIYADRYVQPQSSGHAEVCAGTYTNSSGQTLNGDVFLGYPQADDGAAYNPTTDPGQSTMTHGSPIQDGGCTGSPSQVGMTGSPTTDSECAAGYAANQSGSSIKFDPTDQACEADPAIQPPTVAPPPSLPSSPTFCGNGPTGAGGKFLPGVYGSIQSCNGSGQPVLNISTSTGATGLQAGIYVITPGKNTKGCDVTLDGSIDSLPGVTFYLEGGAGICMSIASGATITQTAYNSGSGKAGDGVYDVLSDNVANPSITLTSSGGGSNSGIWQPTGTIWLPTGTITINNKTALEDQGQVTVDTWNDQSGYHPDPSVTYNPNVTPPQDEVLRLVQ